jgi:thiamine-monophosphate kinase
MIGSEFQLIQDFFSDQQPLSRSDVCLGIGDDCAILRPHSEMDIAVSIDTLISGVHFPHHTAADAIAYKALAVNLSDLAAMGAQPAWFTLSLTLPSDLNFLSMNTDSQQLEKLTRKQWLEQFSQALFLLAKTYNIQLVGGDTTCGPLAITIQVSGYLPKSGGLRRAGAKVGDLIVLTGALGAATIGLDIVLKQHSEQFSCLSIVEQQQAIQALNYPKAKINEGLYLQPIAHAAVDLSDGLISDLGHILKASQVGARLALERLPLASSLACLDKKIAWQKALTGGDDYQLCVTLDRNDWPNIKKCYPQFTVIGIITIEPQLRLFITDNLDDLEHHNTMPEYKIHLRGYDHFG